MENEVFFTNFQHSKVSRSEKISVRGMQYVLDMTVNTKKPDDLAHKLPYKCYRIQPLVLWPYPEDFEKLAYPENFL